MVKVRIFFIALASSVLLMGCAPSAFIKGEYDNVERKNLLADKWSETDMQRVVSELVTSLLKASVISKTSKPPVIMVTRLQNNTSEHIDTQSITDMIRVELQRTGRFRFVDKPARGDVADEYEYQSSGIVSKETKTGPGAQIGADYIINGRLSSTVQQGGRSKTIYYKITLNLTNLSTNIVEWSEYKQIRKKFKKRSVGF